MKSIFILSALMFCFNSQADFSGISDEEISKQILESKIWTGFVNGVEADYGVACVEDTPTINKNIFGVAESFFIDTFCSGEAAAGDELGFIISAEGTLIEELGPVFSKLEIEVPGSEE